MEPIYRIIQHVFDFLSTTALTIGSFRVTLWSIFATIFAFIILIYVTGIIKAWTTNQLLRKSSLDLNTKQAIGTFARYFILVLGLLIILETSGVDLTSFAFIAGALGVGIGLGLQNITNNFVSGLIILLERPIKVGDRVEIGTIIGDVSNISARATTITTNDNIAIIVPNSEFISSRVINWSHTDRKVRLQIHVGVSYSSDPEFVKELLLEVAREQTDLLSEPAPDVVFLEFGESSLNFALRVWTSVYINKPFVLKSSLNFAIAKKFRENNVVIPFPQRDLHIRSNFSEIKKSTVSQRRKRKH